MNYDTRPLVLLLKDSFTLATVLFIKYYGIIRFSRIRRAVNVECMREMRRTRIVQSV
jgi:hypothetical protein